MRKFVCIAVVIATLGLVLAACEENNPQLDKPSDNTEQPENPNDPEEPKDPEDPKDPEEPEEPEPPTVTPENGLFTITITNKTTLSFEYSITPVDPEMEYIVLYDTTKNLEKNGVKSDEDIPAFDLDTFKKEAEAFGTPLLDHIYKYYVYCGEAPGMMVNGIAPGEEFVVYAYGIKTEGDTIVPTTKVVTLRDRTKSVTLVEKPLDITVDLDGCDAAVTVKPGDYNGRYFLFVDKISAHFPDSEPTDEQLKAVAEDIWYRTLALYLQNGFVLEMAFEDHTAQYTYTKEYELMGATDYFAAAVPLDETGVLYAYPTVKRFKTEEVEESSNTIDIEVYDIKPRSATVKVTPSNDDPFIVALFESAPFEGMSGEEIIAYYLEEFPLYPNEEGFEYRFTGITPNTEHFVAAFGYEGGTVTTELFRYDFKTPEEKIVDIDIKLNVKGWYDIKDLIALDEAYISYEYYSALLSFEVITTPQAQGFYYATYQTATLGETSDEDMYPVLLARTYHENFNARNIITYYDTQYTIFVIAEDKDGNISKVFRSEPIVLTYEGRRDAKEWINMPK